MCGGCGLDRFERNHGVIGSSLVFCNAGMQIALKWLHGCVRGAAKRIVMAA